MVTDALNRKSTENLAMVITAQPLLVKEMKKLDLKVVVPDTPRKLMSLIVIPSLMERIKEKQIHDESLQRILSKITTEYTGNFQVDKQGLLKFHNRLFVPADSGIKEEILVEAHSAPYALHRGGTKMYKDLKLTYWWSGIKKEIAEFIARCLTCQQVKVKHRLPAGKLQSLPILVWKLKRITMVSLWACLAHRLVTTRFG